ncbi:unnamed protein product [Meganyctiphanes norvegica]|uniref:Uncharacterized protein n=1 Tax=Meganyctiphanes norvegica TaxID=48144 RepID=A0AAV2QML9_MEGNR
MRKMLCALCPLLLGVLARLFFKKEDLKNKEIMCCKICSIVEQQSMISMKNKGDSHTHSGNMPRIQEKTVCIDNESGEVLAMRMGLRISMNHPWRLVGDYQRSPAVCQDHSSHHQDSEKRTQVKRIKFRINHALGENHESHEKSLSRNESVETYSPLKKQVNISVFKEFLFGDQVFDELFVDRVFQNRMNDRKMRMGAFKRNVSTTKFCRFIQNHVPFKLMCLICFMIIYTMFFIIPTYCPFAICLLLTIKFTYYYYMHKKIHQRAEMLSITPVFTGTVFASGLIWAVRKNCSKCKDKIHTDAVFRYYKGSWNEDTKNKCSLPIITHFLK